MAGEPSFPAGARGIVGIAGPGGVPSREAAKP
jgi:hypothetical protein